MDKDLHQLRQLIGEALARLPVTRRALEDELGIGHGNLVHLVSGRVELRLRHLLTVARLLQVPPHRLIELGCPAATAAATRDVTDFVAVAGARPAPWTADELDERIRAIVRDELARKAAAS